MEQQSANDLWENHCIPIAFCLGIPMADSPEQCNAASLATPNGISMMARLLLLLTAKSLRRLEISWLHVGDALDPR
jgi:hypothetical protein